MANGAPVSKRGPARGALGTVAAKRRGIVDARPHTEVRAGRTMRFAAGLFAFGHVPSLRRSYQIWGELVRNKDIQSIRETHNL